MKDIKILIVLIFFTGLTYYGIEPYAHHIMHPAVAEADYEYKDLGDRKAIESMVASANVATGGEQVMANCTACHSIKSQGLSMMSDADLISANGLLPPDLSNAGSMYDEAYLFAFIKNPANAAFNSTYETHKKAELANAKAMAASEEDKAALVAAHQKSVDGFKNKKAETFSKMPGFDWLGDAEVANIVAYLKSISKPVAELSGKEITVSACVRCHSVLYDKVEVQANTESLAPYLGSFPPDLSQMIRSKGNSYLHTFINDPQKHLLGTGMPRVGLTKEAEAKVVDYIEVVGDPNIEARKTVGQGFVLFFLIFSFFAMAWKKNEFKEVGK